LVPVVIVLGALTFYPFISAVISSFVGPEGSFSGANYARMIDDPRFWNSLRVTFQFSSISVAFAFVLGFGLALLLHRQLSGRATYRTLLMIPMIVTPTVSALIFRHLMFDTELGMFNFILTSLGLAWVRWISGPEALYSLVLVDVWQWTPFVMLILLAGLQSLPQQVFEAAATDGASRWQVFAYVTVPLLKKAIAVAVLFRTIDAVRTFDIIMGTTEGGPGWLTETLNINTYLQIFRYNHYNYGAALTITMFLIILVISNFLVRLIMGEKAA